MNLFINNPFIFTKDLHIYYFHNRCWSQIKQREIPNCNTKNYLRNSKQHLQNTISSSNLINHKASDKNQLSNSFNSKFSVTSHVFTQNLIRDSTKRTALSVIYYTLYKSAIKTHTHLLHIPTLSCIKLLTLRKHSVASALQRLFKEPRRKLAMKILLHIRWQVL